MLIYLYIYSIQVHQSLLEVRLSIWNGIAALTRAVACSVFIRAQENKEYCEQRLLMGE